MNRTADPQKRPLTDDRNSLPRFAAHVRLNRMNEFVQRELELFTSYGLPMLKHLERLPAALLTELTRQSAERFLIALENDAYEALIRDSFGHWEKDELGVIKREQITLQDILIINSAQKMALLHFVPGFTKDPADAIEIAGGLELIYQRAQLKAISLLEQLKMEGEMKVKDTEERYRDLFDNSTDLIHFVTPEGRLLYVNNAWKQTLGYGEEELAGESLYFFICSKDRDRYRAYRHSVMDGKAGEEPIRISFMTKDNREVIAEGMVSVRSKEGKVEYTRGIFKDVTRRVQNEEKLQFYTQQVLEREEKLRHLINNAPDAIIVINEENQINVWNPKAEELFGWTAAEVMGTSLSETIIPPRFREAHAAGMKRLLDTGVTRILNQSVEISALKKDNTEFYVSLTISRALLPQGSLFISFLRDISEKKRNESALEAQRIQLERTNSELEQYAWVTSHDLKEPLRKIRTFSDMLLTRQQQGIPEEALGKIRKIHESAERMDRLIEAILLYSHSSTGEAVEPVDLNEIMTEVLSDLEFAISNKDAVVETVSLPVVNGIPFQLRQLFQNLVSNALKYSKPGYPPHIKLSCAREGGMYRITVADNGIGFKPEFAGKIFQVFQRLVGKHEYEGTGIGLALCKKIVENHGGAIHAHGIEGVGASFEVLLPS